MGKGPPFAAWRSPLRTPVWYSREEHSTAHFFSNRFNPIPYLAIEFISILPKEIVKLTVQAFLKLTSASAWFHKPPSKAKEPKNFLLKEIIFPSIQRGGFPQGWTGHDWDVCHRTFHPFPNSEKRSWSSHWEDCIGFRYSSWSIGGLQATILESHSDMHFQNRFSQVLGTNINSCDLCRIDLLLKSKNPTKLWAKGQVHSLIVLERAKNRIYRAHFRITGIGWSRLPAILKKWFSCPKWTCKNLGLSPKGCLTQIHVPFTPAFYMCENSRWKTWILSQLVKYNCQQTSK